MNWHKNETKQFTYWIDDLGKRKIVLYKGKDRHGRYVVTLEKRVDHNNNTFTWRYIKEYRAETKTDAMQYIKNAKKYNYWR